MPELEYKNGMPFIGGKPVFIQKDKVNGMTVCYVISDIVEIVGNEHKANGAIYFLDDNNSTLFSVDVSSEIKHGFLDVDYIVKT